VISVERTIHAVNRRAALAWRRVRAGLVDLRVTRAELAAALGVSESEVPTTIYSVRAALADRFPVRPADAEAIREALLTSAPEEIDRIVEQANHIRAHTFDLLGSGPVDLGACVDWHRDFKSGYRWNPATHFSGIRFGEKDGVDVKVPWELSRGQHLPLLAQAYLLTRESAFAKEAVDQIRDWVEHNPPELGVNWTCPMDAAIRAVNWLWTAALLSEAPECDESFFEELVGSLLAHGTYLRSNLEVPGDGIRTNHYIADMVGLLYLGICLSELHAADEWTTFARAELEREMQRQVLPDGANYESSVAYHRLVAEMFVSASILAKKNGLSFTPAFDERLEHMIEFTAAYTKPNGLAPQLGDADDGRLHVLTGYGSTDRRDHRHLLAAGSMLFGRADWYRQSGDRWTEALWLGGAQTHRRIDSQAVSATSAAFQDAGVYILRAADDMVVFTAGRVGSAGLGNHKHNDLLAIEVCLGGEDVLIDPGSYLYTSDTVARDAFRSTRAHNTVMVDGEEQNRIPPKSPFRLHADATPRLVSWKATSDGGVVVAEHDGYTRLNAPLVHTRTVRLDSPRGVYVEDRFADRGAPAMHELSWTFAFAAGCALSTDTDGWLVTTPNGRAFRLTWPTSETMQRLDVEAESFVGSVSPRYGVRHAAPVLRWRYRGPTLPAARFSLQPA
jgi:hypothetical protein